MDPRHDLDHLSQLLDATRAAADEFISTLPERPAAIRPPSPAASPAALPEAGLGGRGALEHFRRTYESGLSGSSGPRYLGFVTGGTTPAALAGDWLTAAYDQNLSNDGDSIATTVEHETLALLRDLFHLPATFAGAFVSGATQANVAALAAARQWAAERHGVDSAEDGLWGLPPIPVLGATPHASVLKALSVLGFGRRAVERTACLPGRLAADPRALDARLAELDVPAIVIGSAGEVNTGDFDDLEALAEICARRGAWFHVDGAFGLFAACDPHRAHLLRGLERADSIAADGHKWLNVPYDSGIVFTRRLAYQEAVFKAVATYLGDGPDLLHRTPENSRRFRALPAWMTLMAYGRDGHGDVVRRCCELAEALGERVAAHPELELLAPVRLNVVCFAPRDRSAARRDDILAQLLADGRVYLTPTELDGRPAIRAAFVNWRTDAADLERIVAALDAATTAAPEIG